MADAVQRQHWGTWCNKSRLVGRCASGISYTHQGDFVTVGAWGDVYKGVTFMSLTVYKSTKLLFKVGAIVRI